MTADHTIEATPGQVAAIERDGFLAVAGPTCPECGGTLDARAMVDYRYGCRTCRGRGVVPTTKPCPECGGGYLMTRADGGTDPCPTCDGDGTVQTVVEVVVPERACPCVGMSEDDCAACPGTIPARTLLRGTAEAVPVVDDVNDWPTEEGTSFLYVEGELLMLYTVDPEADDGYEGWDLSAYGDDGGHFADVPRPEVGDTAWIIRGEGS